MIELATSVIAIDPGSTCGVLTRSNTGTITKAQLSPLETIEWVRYVEPDVVVIERFVIMASTIKKSRAGMHDALDVIGWVTLEAEHLNFEVVKQLPAQGKTITNDRLKKANLYWPGKGHYNDAARHFYLWRAKTEGIT